MAPRAPTTAKQRFEVYEKSLRFVAGGTPAQRRTIKRNFRAAWLARTVNERNEIADRCARALDADTECRRLDTDAQAALAAANALDARVGGQRTIAEELRTKSWQNLHGRAFRLLSALRVSQIESRDAWDALRQGHMGQRPHSDNTSINDAASKYQVALNEIPVTAASMRLAATRLGRPSVPADPTTGVQKIRSVWLPRERLVTWRNAAFTGPQGIATAPVTHPQFLAPGTWIFNRIVGAGGQGTAELWLLFDVNDVLVQRSVRKTIDYSKQWYDARFFAGPPGDVSGRLPLELDSHFHMRRAQGQPRNDDQGGINIENEYIVALAAASNRAMVDDVKELYRIYTEWCPNGDLGSIIAHFRGAVPPRHVPEPFIWAVADALIYAGVAMQTGTESGQILPGWRPIVHRDLKPGNVFLASGTNTARWPFYPIPVVGDWGLAVKPTPSSNPKFYQGCGTRGCFAPEQIAYVDNHSLAPLNPWPLDEKTNVFGVGIVLYCLVTQQHTPEEQAWWLGDGSADTTYRLDPLQPLTGPDDPKRFANHYSTDLRQFIDECTTYDHGARADFTRLRALFNQAATKNFGMEDPAITRGMLHGTAPPAVRQAERVPIPPDVYAVGLLRANIP